MFRFDFAISYAGEEKGIARDMCELLKQQGAKVFFAENEEVYLLGKSLKSELPHIFGLHTKFAVPLVSKNYTRKFWPKREFELMKKTACTRGFEFILPVRVDDVILKGLKKDVSYIDLRSKGLVATVQLLIKKLSEHYPPEIVRTPEHWVATFGVTIENLYENFELPASAHGDYAHLCDWLEEDLMRRLSITDLDGLEVLEDSRDGECLSVRIGFKWNPDKDSLDFGDIAWWEVLEVAEFSQIYPDQ